MARKNDDHLRKWTLEALAALGGEAHHVRVAEYIWTNHEDELRTSGDQFYTWQYDLRWAATSLRDTGEIEPPGNARNGVWRLA